MSHRSKSSSKQPSLRRRNTDDNSSGRYERHDASAPSSSASLPHVVEDDLLSSSTSSSASNSSPDVVKVNIDDALKFLRLRKAVTLWIEAVCNQRVSASNLLHDLKDGAILCDLINALSKVDGDGGSVREEAQVRRILPLDPKANLKAFRKAAKNYGVGEQFLFAPNDLSKSSGEVKLVYMLEALAHVSRGHKFKGARLDVQNVPTVTMDNCGLNEKQLLALRGHLTRFHALRPSLDPYTAHSAERRNKQLHKLHAAAGAQSRAQLRMSTYDVATQFGYGAPAVDPEFVERVVRMQAVWRGALVRKRTGEMRKQIAVRAHVAKEIVDNEAMYLSNLGDCIRFYYEPLKEESQAKKPLLSAQSMQAVFSNFPSLLSLSEALLGNLRPRVADWHRFQTVGDIFLSMADYLKVYTVYVENFDNSLAELQVLLKQKKFEQRLHKLDDNVPSKLDLSSFLIMPVQRVPRYSLLLQEMLRHTPADHPDHENLQRAVAKIGEIADYINERKRQNEQFSELLAFQDELGGGRRVPEFVLRGRRVVRRQHFEEDDVVVVLMSDLMVVCKYARSILNQKNAELRYRSHHEITRCDLVSVKDDARRMSLVSCSTNEELLSLKCEDALERHAWLEDFKAAKRDVIENAATQRSVRNLRRISMNLGGDGSPLDDDENDTIDGVAVMSSTPRARAGRHTFLRQHGSAKTNRDMLSKVVADLRDMRERRAVLAERIAELREGDMQGRGKATTKQAKATLASMLVDLEDLVEEIGVMETQRDQLYARLQDDERNGDDDDNNAGNASPAPRRVASATGSARARANVRSAAMSTDSPHGSPHLRVTSGGAMRSANTSSGGGGGGGGARIERMTSKNRLRRVSSPEVNPLNLASTSVRVPSRSPGRSSRTSTSATGDADSSSSVGANLSPRLTESARTPRSPRDTNTSGGGAKSSSSSSSAALVAQSVADTDFAVVIAENNGSARGEVRLEKGNLVRIFRRKAFGAQCKVIVGIDGRQGWTSAADLAPATSQQKKTLLAQLKEWNRRQKAAKLAASSDADESKHLHKAMSESALLRSSSKVRGAHAKSQTISSETKEAEASSSDASPRVDTNTPLHARTYSQTRTSGTGDATRTSTSSALRRSESESRKSSARNSMRASGRGDDGGGVSSARSSARNSARTSGVGMRVSSSTHDDGVDKVVFRVRLSTDGNDVKKLGVLPKTSARALIKAACDALVKVKPEVEKKIDVKNADIMVKDAKSDNIVGMLSVSKLSPYDTARKLLEEKVDPVYHLVLN